MAARLVMGTKNLALTPDDQSVREEGGLMSEKRATLNAFTPEFLRALRERDEPETSVEAESETSRVLREVAGQFALFRSLRRFEAGDEPEATFESREDALAFLAA